MKPDYLWYCTVEEDHDGYTVMRHDCTVQWPMHNLKLTFDGTGKLKFAEVLEATK
jgi:hypothetical protein